MYSINHFGYVVTRYHFNQQRRLMKATIILLPVMGFTWIIGLFAVGEEGKVFAYLFVFANAFQVRETRLTISKNLQ